MRFYDQKLSRSIEWVADERTEYPPEASDKEQDWAEGMQCQSTI